MARVFIKVPLDGENLFFRIAHASKKIYSKVESFPDIFCIYVLILYKLIKNKKITVIEPAEYRF